jgi:large subunit ribosomal protein L3
MPGLIGKKVGMTSIFDENGNNVPCTLEVGPCYTDQTKEMMDKAVQLSFEKKRKEHAQGDVGHSKASTQNIR